MATAVVDEAEVSALAERWGAPQRHHCQLTIGTDFWLAWGRRWRRGHREVMFLLPRPGGLLLHRKAHYPPDCFRLLTGSIEPGEAVAAAIAREPEEEVGLRLPVRRYVALLSYELHLQQQRFACASHIFLLPFSDSPLRPSHDGEIAESRVLPLDALPTIAEQLERLPAPWHDWGRFRAVAHRLIPALVQPDELA